VGFVWVFLCFLFFLGWGGLPKNPPAPNPTHKPTPKAPPPHGTPKTQPPAHRRRPPPHNATQRRPPRPIPPPHPHPPNFDDQGGRAVKRSMKGVKKAGEGEASRNERDDKKEKGISQYKKEDILLPKAERGQSNLQKQKREIR